MSDDPYATPEQSGEPSVGRPPTVQPPTWTPGAELPFTGTPEAQPPPWAPGAQPAPYGSASYGEWSPYGAPVAPGGALTQPAAAPPPDGLPRYLGAPVYPGAIPPPGGVPAYPGGAPTYPGARTYPGAPAYPGAPTYPPYGATPWGGPPSGDVYGRPLAGWWARVGAFMLDQLIAFGPWMVMYAYVMITAVPSYDMYGRPTTVPTTAGVVVMLVSFVWLVGAWGWNRWFRQARTGQSLGKRALGIRLVQESTGLPPGRGRAFARDGVHLAIDGFCYLGYLWPLWDPRKQTWADKVCSTIVIQG